MSELNIKKAVKFYLRRDGQPFQPCQDDLSLSAVIFYDDVRNRIWGFYNNGMISASEKFPYDFRNERPVITEDEFMDLFPEHYKAYRNHKFLFEEAEGN